MPKLRVCIYGAAGKVGLELIRRANLRYDFFEITAVDTPEGIKLLENTILRVNEAASDVRAVLDRVDCIVDFSTAVASSELVDHLLGMGEGERPTLIVGTTGHNEEYAKKLKKLAKLTPVFKSTNFTFGILLLNFIVRLTARKMLKSTDVEISEFHHRDKRDAPSGTALEIAQIISEETGGEIEYRTKPEVDGRAPGSIGLSWQRGGAIPGEHRVTFAFGEETLEIKHAVLDRRSFAVGALFYVALLHGRKVADAANPPPADFSWKKREPKLYTMYDMLVKFDEVEWE